MKGSSRPFQSAVAFHEISRKCFGPARPIPRNDATVRIDFTNGFTTFKIAASSGSVRLEAGARRRVSADPTPIDLKMKTFTLEAVIDRAIVIVIATEKTTARRSEAVTPGTEK